LTASDGDSGVASITYALDGVDTTVPGALALVNVPALPNGPRLITCYATDLAANSCEERVLSFTIDTRGPTTRALARASVRRGRRATLRYRVDDALSPTARVTIRVKTRSGRTVKTLKAVTRKTNVATSSRFTCKLAKGSYRFHVYATDLAGNRQVRKGYGTLRVRR
jgi:hypothetical protein